MGTGKTTVGRILDPKFHDMDELIVEEIGMSINDYFAVEGEAAFRRREAEMLERLLEKEAAIISPGGGIVVNPHNRALLEKNPHNIYLRVDFETLYRRIQNDKAMQRPSFKTTQKKNLRRFLMVVCLCMRILLPILWMSRTKHLKKLRRSFDACRLSWSPRDLLPMMWRYIVSNF